MQHQRRAGWPTGDARVQALEDEIYRLAPLRDRFDVHRFPSPVLQTWSRAPGPGRDRIHPDASARRQTPSWGSVTPSPPRSNQDESEPPREPPTTVVVRKKSKSNSERGRAFRARRKQYEDDLLAIVGALRQEVVDLDFLKGVRAQSVLRSRNSMDGSLVRLAREYFAMFAHGMPTLRRPGQKRPALLTAAPDPSGETLADKQEGFLKSAMDPEMLFGEAKGYQALLDQWRRYTSYHSSLDVEVVGVEVSGPEEDPMVTVRSDLHVTFSRATFENVFPHVAHLEDLVQRFIGREVVYHGVNRFQFSSSGQILVYDSDVGFMDALVRAGASLEDIALIMQQAKIADQCRIGEDDSGVDSGGIRVQEILSDDEDQEQPEHERGGPTKPEDDVCLTRDCVTDADSDTGVSTYDTAACEDSDDASTPPRSRLAIDFLLS